MGHEARTFRVWVGLDGKKGLVYGSNKLFFFRDEKGPNKRSTEKIINRIFGASKKGILYPKSSCEGVWTLGVEEVRYFVSVRTVDENKG